MFIRGLQFRNSFTYYDFKFLSYEMGTDDYSGNRITGIPEYIAITSISLELPLNFYLFARHNYTGDLPLNDANSVYAKAYNLVQLKAGWKYPLLKWNLEIFAGIDNLLNERYSLGNDINAVGGRYYNASPERNYFAGIKGNF